MRKGVLVFVCALAIAAAAYLTYAQATGSVWPADHQVQDKGYIDAGAYKDTPANPRPLGSLYRGAGTLTYQGKPPKPFLQHDMGGNEIDMAGTADRNKPYNHHDLSHVWFRFYDNGLGKIPPMTAAEKAEGSLHITEDEDVSRLHKPSNNPTLTCNPVGWPREVTQGGDSRPFEFFQLPAVTLYHNNWHEIWIKIWTDGRPLPKGNLEPTSEGYSVGKWIGDTFVQDTNGEDPRNWLDSHLALSRHAEIQARWRRIDHNTLQTDFTIRDPEFYLGGDWNTPDILSVMLPNNDVDILPCIPADEFEYRNNSPTENPDPGTETSPEEAP